MDEEKTEKSDSNAPSRIYLGVVIAAFIAVLVLIFAWNDSFYSDFDLYFLGVENSATGGNRVKAVSRLGIDFGNGQRRAFEGPVEDGMTAVSALRAATRVGKLEVSTDERGRVTKIDGVKNNSEKRWQTYLNGAAIGEPPGNILIKGGDKVMFRYE